MAGFLGGFSRYFYALLRIISGLLFALHGTQKLFGFPGSRPRVNLVSLLGVAGVIELVCGLMIAAGLLTTYAAFLASGQMAAAYFHAHSPRGLIPLLNQGELAVLYCFLFLYIAAEGPGLWAVDKRSGTKRRR
jgi:putative oxidoreductase